MKVNFYIFPTLLTLSARSQGMGKDKNETAYKLLFIVDAKKNLLFEIILELSKYAYYRMQEHKHWN